MFGLEGFLDEMFLNTNTVSRIFRSYSGVTDVLYQVLEVESVSRKISGSNRKVTISDGEISTL